MGKNKQQIINEPNNKKQITNPNNDNKTNLIQIEKVDDIYFEAKKQIKPGKKYFKIIETKERTYNHFDKYQIIECFKLQIVNPRSLFDKKSKLMSIIKTVFIFVIFIFLWLNFAIFIQGIYEIYGDNLVFLCVLPLISIFFIKLLISDNISILQTTAFLYFFGKYYTSRRKYGLLQKIALRYFVSPLAFKYYEALFMYQQLLKEY